MRKSKLFYRTQSIRVMVPLFIEALIYKKNLNSDTSDKDDMMVTNLQRGGGHGSKGQCQNQAQ